MKITPLCLFAAFLLSNVFASAAGPADVKGAKDHPLLQRVEGSSIRHFEKKAFDSVIIAEGRVEFDYDAQMFKPFKKEIVEGALTRILYGMPAGVSTLEVLRQYEAELKEKGFEVHFTGSGEELDNGYDRFLKQVFVENKVAEKATAMLTLTKDYRYIAAKLARPEGDVYVRLYIVVNTDWPGNEDSVLQKDQTAALLDVVEVKGMQKRMVTVTSAEMESTIEKTGRVALYGILFDFNKADLKAESGATLDEIAKLLKAEAGLKLIVVGHTDNVGGFDTNRDLSQRRAAAVAQALAGKYGVSAQRLFPFGVSYAAPIAPNETEQGRAKNRRVELVRY